MVSEAGEHTVYDGAYRIVVTDAEFAEMIASPLEKKTIVPFRVEQIEPAGVPLSGGASVILDMCAGSRLFEHEMDDLLDNTNEQATASPAESGDEAEVHVHDALESLVRNEVARYAIHCTRMDVTTARKQGRFRCELCPFRSIPADRNARRNIAQHLRKFHSILVRTGTIQTWVASGTKQCKVIKAMYDLDRFLRACLRVCARRTIVDHMSATSHVSRLCEQ